MSAALDLLRELREEVRDWQDALSGERDGLDELCARVDAELLAVTAGKNNWNLILSAFPDFDHCPDVPACFNDVSWGDDAMPSFRHAALEKLTLYVDYRNQELSEMKGDYCFILDEEQNTVYSGDDLAAAVTLILDHVVLLNGNKPA